MFACVYSIHGNKLVFDVCLRGMSISSHKLTTPKCRPLKCLCTSITGYSSVARSHQYLANWWTKGMSVSSKTAVQSVSIKNSCSSAPNSSCADERACCYRGAGGTGSLLQKSDLTSMTWCKSLRRRRYTGTSTTA